MNVQPSEVVEWGQHPLTRLLIVVIGGAIVSGFMMIAAAIIAVIKWIHPAIKAGVVSEAVNEAREPFDAHLAESQELREQYNLSLHSLKEGQEHAIRALAVLSDGLGEVRSTQLEHAEMLGAINGKLQVMMNGHFKDRRGTPRHDTTAG